MSHLDYQQQNARDTQMSTRVTEGAREHSPQ